MPEPMDPEGHVFIVFKEHHGEVVYDATASGGESAVLAHVLRERDREGNDYYGLLEPPGPEPKRPDPIPDSMTDPEIRAVWERRLKAYDGELRAWNDERRLWVMVEAARGGDIRCARMVMERANREQWDDWTYTVHHSQIVPAPEAT